MIKSMTGYGKAIQIENLREYQVEIRSVNHRYLDINIRIPRNIGFLEDEIRKSITAKIKRGKIDVFVSFINNSQEEKNIKINRELAKIYIKELRELAIEEGLKSNIEVTEITKFPDVLSIQMQEDDKIIKKELLQAVNTAISNLVEMREIEGNKIIKDLQKRLTIIKENVKEISSISTGLIKEYIVKLEDRIKEILKSNDIDKSRLAQEVVIYADKCSIEEEITRLESHIIQLINLLEDTKEAVGKKIDFIIQEMNRETNTIGSKANNLKITNTVVNIKTEIENIREQVQNIE